MENQWHIQRSDCKYFPSIQKGMSLEEEIVHRVRGVCLIECVGNRLEFPLHTIATASTLFHRFFCRKSFYEHNANKIAQACLFIAGKSDESSRRANDIAKSWLYKPNQAISERKINAFVTDLLYYELVVLEVTCFDLQIDHPYYVAIEIAQELDAPDQVIRAASAFINDGFRMPLCIWYDSTSIAVTALLMAYQGCDLTFPFESNTMLGDYLEENSDLFREIAKSIMDVYNFQKHKPNK